MSYGDQHCTCHECQRPQKPDAGATAARIFKPYIVRRPNGGCQVLFPLSELDSLINQVLAIAKATGQ